MRSDPEAKIGLRIVTAKTPLTWPAAVTMSLIATGCPMPCLLMTAATADFTLLMMSVVETPVRTLILKETTILFTRGPRMFTEAPTAIMPGYVAGSAGSP